MAAASLAKRRPDNLGKQVDRDRSRHERAHPPADCDRLTAFAETGNPGPDASSVPAPDSARSLAGESGILRYLAAGLRRAL
jgi:hypothetical protein